MLFIPSEYLKHGMILGRDLNINVANLPLLTKGQILTDSYISKIKDANISGVYIDSEMSIDVDVKELVNVKLKNKALHDIKHIFDEYSRENEITYYNIETISNLAKGLVTEVLSKEDIIINLTELNGYDDYTYRHSLSVALLSISIGMKLGFTYDMLAEVATCALLHDIGKMNIPVELLNKNGSLTNAEFDVIKQHPITAYDQLRKSGMLSFEELCGIVSHHEKYNGSGYPYGLKGNNIHMYARVLAIADVYDAITSDRPYRAACFPNEAIEYMMSCAGSHFDHGILITFLKIVAVYPSGTIVKLSTDQRAIVIKNHEENTLRPTIRIIKEDGTYSEDIDLFHDTSYFNVTITGMGYDNGVNYDLLRKGSIINVN